MKVSKKLTQLYLNLSNIVNFVRQKFYSFLFLIIIVVNNSINTRFSSNMHIPYEPASAPVEERKYDPNLNSGQNVELNSGRPNGFNRNFGYWNAAQSF